MFLLIGEEILVVFDLGLVISDRDKIALVVHTGEGFGVVADMIDEEDAVEVVDFVKKGSSEVAASFDTDFGAVFEDGFDFGFRWATNKAVNIGDGEAAFLVDLRFAFSANDFWVDESGKRLIIFIIEVVANNNNALVLAKLGGGHGSRKLVRVLIFPVKRGGNHVGNKFASFVGNFVDFGGFVAQTRVGSGDNFSHIIYYNI